MTVLELMSKLSTMPIKAEVKCVWGGGARSSVDNVYLARSGKVLMASNGEPLHYDEDRPVGAPSTTEDKYWLIGEEDDS